MNLAYKTQKLAKMLKVHLKQKVEVYGLTPQQYAVLKDSQIHSNQELSAVEIGNHLDIDKPTMSGIISRLVRDLYIYKQQSNTDKRSQNIYLTPKGINTLLELESINDVINDLLIKDLTNEEVSLLNTFLDKMIINMEDKSDE